MRPLIGQTVLELDVEQAGPGQESLELRVGCAALDELAYHACEERAPVGLAAVGVRESVLAHQRPARPGFAALRMHARSAASAATARPTYSGVSDSAKNASSAIASRQVASVTPKRS